MECFISRLLACSIEQQMLCGNSSALRELCSLTGTNTVMHILPSSSPITYTNSLATKQIDRQTPSPDSH